MYLLYKNQGQTCGEVISRLKAGLVTPITDDSGTHIESSVESKGYQSRAVPLPQLGHIIDHPISTSAIDQDSLTYVGRLDPLAEGLLIVLKGNEIAHKQELLDLDKVYEFEIVCGVATDSFDQLGCIYPSSVYHTWNTLNYDAFQMGSNSSSHIDFSASLFSTQLQEHIHEKKLTQVQQLFEQLIGEYTMHYPFFSSKPIDGMPLYAYTKVHGVEATNALLPTKRVSLHAIECRAIEELSLHDLYTESIALAQSQKGDFRQEEIISSWEKYYHDVVSSQGSKDLKDPHLTVLKMSIQCSSGFYVRVFSAWIGQLLGVGAIARNIKRVQMGEYSIYAPEIIRYDEMN